MIMDGGLVEKLVEFQRSELGGALIEMDKCDSDSDQGSDGKGVSMQKVHESRRERRYLLRRPFASCVARFAVQLEVAEGLRHRERYAFKQEILVRAKKASLSDAEASTIIAKVLRGSSP